MALVDIADKETVAPELDTDLLGVTRPGGITALFTLSEIFGLIAKASVTVGTGGDYASLAAAQSAGKKWISLLPGTYSGAQSITQNDTILTGYGATFTAQTAASTFTVSGSNVRIEGVAVNGSHDGDSADMGGNTAGTAFYVTGDGAEIHKCTVANTVSYAVYVNSADRVKVTDCTFTNVATAAAPTKYVRYAVFYTGSLYGETAGNYISGWSQAVGYWYGSSYGRIHHNTLINNYGYIEGPGTRSCIEIYGEDDSEIYDTIAHHNHIDGATSGCLELADKLRGVKAHHNYCANFGAGNLNGIGVASGAFGVNGSSGDEGYDVTVSDNYIVGRGATTLAGCGVMGSNIVIRDNEFVDYQATSDLIVPLGDCQNLDISGNKFRNCGRIITLSWTANNVATIHNNKIYGFVSVGGNWRCIHIQIGRGHSLKDNQFYNVGDNAAIMVDSSAEGTLVENNKSFALAGAAAGRIQDIGKRTRLIANYVEGETQSYSYFLDGTNTLFDNNESVGGQLYFHTACTGKGRDNYVLNYARSGAGTITDNSGGGMVLTATLP